MLLLELAWTGISRPGRSAPQRTPSPPTVMESQGTLVYAAPADGDPRRQVLWKLDLRSRTLTRGPEIPRAVELVGPSLVGPGRIGITARGPSGRLTAYVLNGTSPADVPVRLGTGDFVSWGSQGRVAFAPSGWAACPPVAIDLVAVEDGSAERVSTLRHLCGRLSSLGGDGTLTSFTRRKLDEPSVALLGVGAARTILPGYEMRSVSSGSVFLLSPPRSRVLLYWPGRGRPVACRSRGRALEASRVLGWAPDSSRAVVAGHLGRRAGLFIVRARITSEVSTPRVKLAVLGQEGLGAAFSEAGTLYLVADGHLYRYSDELAEPLLITQTPRPAGPVAWIP
jgi:hypothetical protein